MQFGIKWDTDAFAAWVAQADRSIHIDGRVEHMAQLVLILGSHDLHVGNYAHESDIEDTVLSGAILTNDAGPIHGEDNVQVLHADIVDHLIKGTLQKGGVDGSHRAHTSHSQTGGKVTACCSAIPTSKYRS